MNSALDSCVPSKGPKMGVFGIQQIGKRVLANWNLLWIAIERSDKKGKKKFGSWNSKEEEIWIKKFN